MIWAYTILSIINVLFISSLIYFKYFRVPACNHTYEEYDRYNLMSYGDKYGVCIINRCTKCGCYKEFKITG